MSPRAALAFVKQHGVVLASARGPVPSLAEAIAGEPIRGSWWAHPKSHAIYAVLAAVEASPDVLVCRLVGGKRTFVHRRLWPALVRAASRFPRATLARVREVHTARGRHALSATPFPRWVPAAVAQRATALALDDALAQLGLASASAPPARRA